MWGWMREWMMTEGGTRLSHLFCVARKTNPLLSLFFFFSPPNSTEYIPFVLFFSLIASVFLGGSTKIKGTARTVVWRWLPDQAPMQEQRGLARKTPQSNANAATARTHVGIALVAKK